MRKNSLNKYRLGQNRLNAVITMNEFKAGNTQKTFQNFIKLLKSSHEAIALVPALTLQAKKGRNKCAE